MRQGLAALGVMSLLCGCGSDAATTGGEPNYAHMPYAYSPYAYHDWLYLHYHWYDDDFWIWADDHPDCCYDRDDIKQAMQTWYDGLDPSQQQAVRDRVQTWLDDHGVEPSAGQSPRDLVVETASQRWATLTPAERQQWRDQRTIRIEQRRAADSASQLTPDQRAALRERAASLSPEQRAVLRESGQGLSFDRASGSAGRSISNHPTPSRAGLSGGVGFRAARGGGRGGRGR